MPYRERAELPLEPLSEKDKEHAFWIRAWAQVFIGSSVLALIIGATVVASKVVTFALVCE
jgi:hypothetical protein